MKKIKRILALIGVLLLTGLYVSTLIFSLLDSPNADNLLKLSIYGTVVVPVMLWAYALIYKLTKKK